MSVNDINVDLIRSMYYIIEVLHLEEGLYTTCEGGR